MEEPPHLKWKDEMPFKKSLKGDRQEVFVKDSDLVQRAQEDYFRANCPYFDHETSDDLAGLFRDMITSVNLLDSEIFEIQEVWTGQRDLQYANDAL